MSRRHSDMKPLARWLGAVVLVVGLATGCGGGNPPASPSAGGSAPQQSNAAVSVRVVVTGGIAGDHNVYEVSRNGATASAERILDLASAPAVRDLATQRKRPSVKCCDIQVYEVTIRYADGSSTRITTDTTSAPPQLQRLVSLASAR